MTEKATNHITVCNIHTIPAGHLPIRIDRSSVFGNPFTIKDSGSRSKAIARYKTHLWEVVQGDAKQFDPLRDSLRQLVRAFIGGANIALICHCAPKPCHGDVLAAFTEWAANETMTRMNARASK